jgi:hypothetical protein
MGKKVEEMKEGFVRNQKSNLVSEFAESKFKCKTDASGVDAEQSRDSGTDVLTNPLNTA